MRPLLDLISIKTPLKRVLKRKSALENFKLYYEEIE